MKNWDIGRVKIKHVLLKPMPLKRVHRLMVWVMIWIVASRVHMRACVSAFQMSRYRLVLSQMYCFRVTYELPTGQNTETLAKLRKRGLKETPLCLAKDFQLENTWGNLWQQVSSTIPQDEGGELSNLRRTNRAELSIKNYDRIVSWSFSARLFICQRVKTLQNPTGPFAFFRFAMIQSFIRFARPRR